MSRIIGTKLQDKLISGEYASIFKSIKNDSDLSAEMREGELIVYYKKCKIVSLKEKTLTILSSGYFSKDEKKEKDLRDKIKNQPEYYFKSAKELIDKHGPKKEFTIQQNIAMQNIGSGNEDYIVIDMEYQYKQSDVAKNERLDKTRIDLLAVEKSTNDIVLFELKQGCGALEKESGLEDHIRKTNNLINNNDARTAIENDVKAIWKQKNELGLISSPCPDCLGEMKMLFVFAYFKKEEKSYYDKLINAIPNAPKTIYFNLTPQLELHKP